MGKEQNASLGEHLGELRTRILWIMVWFVINLGIGFVFVDEMYEFLSRDGLRMFPELGEFKLTVLGPGEIIKVYFTLATILAVGLSIPIAFYQAWRFVSPAFDDRVRKTTFRLLPLVAAVFFVGIAFGYYLIFPMVFHFLYVLGSAQFEVMFTAGNYFGFLMNIVIPFGVMFELPVAVAFLTWIGLLTPEFLQRIRKYAYLVLVIIASILSPPEIISHLSLAVPLFLLYEIAIVIAKWAYRKRETTLLATETAATTEPHPEMNDSASEHPEQVIVDAMDAWSGWTGMEGVSFETAPSKETMLNSKEQELDETFNEKK